MVSDKSLYLNKSQRRKKQIYNWFLDTMFDSGLNLDNVQKSLNNDKFDNAFRKFELIVESVIKISEQKGEVLGYILRENFTRFGKFRVLKDLFNNIVLVRFKKKVKVESKLTDKEKVKLRTIIKKKKKEVAFNFGLNKKGTRKKAILRPVIIKNKVQFRLVDVKTKQYLSFTPTVKKIIKKLEVDEE